MKKINSYELLDLFDKAIVVFDDSLEVLYINEAFDTLFGFDKDEIKTMRDLHDKIHPSLAFCSCPLIGKIMEKVSDFKTIERLETNRGIRTFSVLLKKVKYKYFMIFSDITDDLDLKRNSLILHQILENATVEIIITDKNGRIE
ncbi:MAG: hypothetical protein N3C60_01980, partial [Calditerrivibrio sp.]|nr:hypothetical protein [Calditerrivibrio sp.]